MCLLKATLTALLGQDGVSKLPYHCVAVFQSPGIYTSGVAWEEG